MKTKFQIKWCSVLVAWVAFAVTHFAHAELVGYWPLDGSLVDLSGQGNDGELIGDPEFADDIAEVLSSGQSMYFDGDDAVLLGNPDILNFGTSDFTIAAWAKKDNTGQRGNIYSNGGDNGGGVRSVLAIGESGGAQSVVLTLDDDSNKRQPRSGDPRDATGLGLEPSGAEDEVWNHVVGVKIGNEARVYINGVLADVDGLPDGYDLSGMSQLPSYLGVGASANSDPIGAFEKWYIGFIDEVAVWDEAKSEEFIMNLASGLPILEQIENPGDFNMDGVVDLADFLIMASNFNESFPIAESYAKGDASRNGRVDLADFVIVREEFGNGVAGASPVPEPSTFGLAVFGLLALAARRRRK